MSLIRTFEMTCRSKPRPTVNRQALLPPRAFFLFFAFQLFFIQTTKASEPFEFSTPTWSGDGRQFAYLASSGDEGLLFGDGWLFGGGSSRVAREKASPRRVTSQLWIGTIATGRSELLDETTGRFSVPGWSPDGKSVYYVRFRPSDGRGPVDREEAGSGAESEGLLELVRRHRNGRMELIHARHGTWPIEEVIHLPRRVTACSENGLYVVAPWLGPSRLLVVAVGDHRLEHEIPDADHASFSPGSRFLVYAKTNESPGIHLTPMGRWTESKPVCPNLTLQEPVCWSRGGGSFFIQRRGDQLATSRRHDPQDQFRIEITQFSISDSSERLLQKLMLNSEEPPSSARTMLAFDQGREVLYVSVLQPGLPPVFESLDTESLEKRVWHPLCDELSEHRVPLGAQAVSRDSKYLLFRFGLPEWCAPLALYDLPRNRWRTWVSNHSLRARGLWALVATARRIIRRVPAETPSPFFVPPRTPFESHLRAAEELTSPMDLFDRPKDQASRDDQQRADLDRLAKLGLELLESGSRVEDASWEKRRAELSLFFHYAREDYASALNAAGRVEELWPVDEPVERRMALAAVQAQCMIGAGRGQSARVLLTRLIQERSRQLAGAEGIQERRELLLLGIDLGAVSKTYSMATSDPILERLVNLLDIAEESADVKRPAEEPRRP